MTEATALHILQLDRIPPVDDLSEIVDEQLFELRDYFLRNPIIRELYENRIARMARIAEAASILGLEFKPRKLPLLHPVNFEVSELAELLRRFEQALAQARLVLASTLDPEVLRHTCKEMIAFQEAFEASFMQLTSEVAPSEGEVRAAEHIDTGRLLRALSSGYRPDAELLISKERKRILNRLTRQAGH